MIPVGVLWDGDGSFSDPLLAMLYNLASCAAFLKVTLFRLLHCLFYTVQFNCITMNNDDAYY